MDGNSPRNWVKFYAEYKGKNKTEDQKAFRQEIANLPASEFLARFVEGGDFINFLRTKENNEVDNIPALQQAMRDLQVAHSELSAELRGGRSFDGNKEIEKSINNLPNTKLNHNNSSSSALVSFSKNFQPEKSKQKLTNLLEESKKVAEDSNLKPKENLLDIKINSDRKFVELLKENRNPYHMPAQVNQPPQINPAEQNMVEDDIEMVVEENGGPRLLSPIMMA
jgi:hypothetical protein